MNEEWKKNKAVVEKDPMVGSKMREEVASWRHMSISGSVKKQRGDNEV